MATRFYLSTAGYAPLSPAVDASWNHAPSTQAFPMYPYADGSPMTVQSTAFAGVLNTNAYVLDRVYLSPPFQQQQTVSGTLYGQIRVAEPSTAVNARTHLVVRVVRSDGTLRGVLYAGDPRTGVPPTTDEITTSVRNQKIPAPTAGDGTGVVTLNSVGVSVGDRIIAEIGFYAYPASTANRTMSSQYGAGAASDHPVGGTNNTALNPWIEFSADLNLYPSLENVTETFTGATVSTATFPEQYNNNVNGAISTVDGKAPLVFTPAGSWINTGTAAGAVRYDARQDSVSTYFEPPAPSANAAGLWFHVRLYPRGTTGDYYGLSWNQAANSGVQTVRSRRSVNGVVTESTPVTYNATSHAAFTIAENGGNLYLGARNSATGATTWLTTIATPAGMSNVHVEWVAQSDANTNPAGPVVYLRSINAFPPIRIIDGIALPVEQDAPELPVQWSDTATPDGIAEAIGLSTHTITSDLATTPTGIAVTAANDAPSAAQVYSDNLTPDGIAEAVEGDSPQADFIATADDIATPDGIAETVSLDDPAAEITNDPQPDGIAETVNTDAPSVTVESEAQPGGIAATVATDEPVTAFVAAYDATAEPTGVSLDSVHDEPTITEARTAEPDSVTDAAVTSDEPTVAITITATPTGFAVTAVSDAPTIVTNFYVPPTPRAYGSGTYGVGNYGKGTGGSGEEPASLTASLADGLNLPVIITAPGSGTVNDPPPAPAATGYGSGAYGTGAYGVLNAEITPDGLAVTLSIDTPSTNGQQATGYGSGTYGVGPYGTATPAPPTPTPGNGGYGTGDYGAGVYAGAPINNTENPVVVPPIQPPTPGDGTATPPPGGFIYPDDDYRAPRLPTHILGIGPWNNGAWRGAPNHGAKAGDYPSAPIIGLPATQSKSFTLRLNAGSEARADHDMSRFDAIVIEQMVTDLWWRRIDPNTRTVEVIGRYNADKVDIASSESGLRMSVSWVDYQALLEDRLVTQYKDGPPANQSQWNKGASLNEILTFALPTNMGLDLSAVSGTTRVNLGLTKEIFELPLGSTIREVMANLQSISVTPWEWWVEMAPDAGARPKLMLTPGQRGRDRGITLFDIDGVRGPIASWTMQSAADRYANAVYFQGGTGGGLYVNDTGIARYGQRDATGSDSSLGGQIKLIDAAANELLAKLSDQRPSYTMQLREGFWEGRHHIDVGDWLSIHIRLGADVITDKYRVTEINVEIDNNGREQVSITVGTPRPARDPRSRQSAVARLVRRLKNYERKGP